MAKRKVADIITEIRKLLEEKKLVIGGEGAVKNLKIGKVEKIYLAANCSPDVGKDIAHYSKLGKVPVVKLSYANDELGVICKKPFSVSVLSVLKVQSVKDKV